MIGIVFSRVQGEIIEIDSAKFIENQLRKNGSVSLDVSIKDMQELVYEFAWKESGAVYASVVNYLKYTYNPNIYGLDLPQPFVDTANKIAKIVIFLHGAFGGPFTFLDYAKEYEREGIRNMYTVNLQQTDDDPVPLHQITEKIKEIASQCFSAGAEIVDVSLQGHSLGALVASKYVWRAEPIDDRVNVSMMISIGGRLHFDECRLSWFCGADVCSEIEKTYAAYVENPLLLDLYTIWGAIDELVPEESVHIQGLSERELTIEDCGHLGIIYAKQAIDQSLRWTEGWVQNSG